MPASPPHSDLAHEEIEEAPQYQSQVGPAANAAAPLLPPVLDVGVPLHGDSPPRVGALDPGAVCEAGVVHTPQIGAFPEVVSGAPVAGGSRLANA